MGLTRVARHAGSQQARRAAPARPALANVQYEEVAMATKPRASLRQSSKSGSEVPPGPSARPSRRPWMATGRSGSP